MQPQSRFLSRYWFPRLNNFINSPYGWLGAGLSTLLAALAAGAVIYLVPERFIKTLFVSLGTTVGALSSTLALVIFKSKHQSIELESDSRHLKTELETSFEKTKRLLEESLSTQLELKSRKSKIERLTEKNIRLEAELANLEQKNSQLEHTTQSIMAENNQLMQMCQLYSLEDEIENEELFGFTPTI